MEKIEIQTFYPTSRTAWRQWLQENHQSAKAVWLMQYKKKANKPTLSWEEAVEEALCFGWIDSIRKSVDQDSFIQFFSPRKAKSAWSKINKTKVAELIDAGLMAEAGLATIEIAKQNGYWSILDEVEELTVPKELIKAFKANKGAKQFFEGLSKSARKQLLQWIAVAKQIETKTKRINEIAEYAAQGLKPKQFR